MTDQPAPSKPAPSWLSIVNIVVTILVGSGLLTAVVNGCNDRAAMKLRQRLDEQKAAQAIQGAVNYTAWVHAHSKAPPAPPGVWATTAPTTQP